MEIVFNFFRILAGSVAIISVLGKIFFPEKLEAFLKPRSNAFKVIFIILCAFGLFSAIFRF